MLKNVRNAAVKHINDNKILEMYDGGCGKNTIVGVFKDHGINTTSEYVQGVIETRDSNYSTKFLPNAAVKQAISATAVFSQGTDDMLPA